MKVKRKPIPKDVRQKVYDKFKGHCAYCGCELKYKDMQVDHFLPIAGVEWGKYKIEQIECFENYFPACRMCNYAKRCQTIESFRRELGKILGRLEKTFIYRLAKKYNLIQELPHKIVFYYEKNS